MINSVEHAALIVKLNLKLLRSSLCDYSDAYIAVKGTIIVPNTALHKKMKFLIKNIVTKCDIFGNFLRIWSHLL